MLGDDHIQLKLRSHLYGKLIDNEPRLIYLLFQCRNLLKGDNPLEGQLPTLAFYCNFGLNVPLCHAEERAFLERVNPTLTNTPTEDIERHDALDEFLTLKSFRREMRSLLNSIGADPSICEDLQWPKFLSVYALVAQSSSLVIEEGLPASGLQKLAVERVKIYPAARLPFADLAAKVYPMLWLIEYEDGRFGSLELGKCGLANTSPILGH